MDEWFLCECVDGCHGQVCECDLEEWEVLYTKITDRNRQAIIRKLCPEFTNHKYISLIAESNNLALVED